MKCIVTAGPTYEPLDEVRRLTNSSTGRLGSKLASFLSDHGHEVTLLIGQPATWRGARRAHIVKTFSTTASLHDHLQALAGDGVDAVFHAAAVSDFAFGKILVRSSDGELTEARSGKISTRSGTLLAEMVPTPKIIGKLCGWFPRARAVGWKLEVEGDRASVLQAAESQLAECRTDACVANGRAYGEGFGLVTGPGQSIHLPGMQELFEALEEWVAAPRK